jgi:tetratricopeptide (TPR) repeat protein
MIEKKTIKEISSAMRSNYQTAMGAVEKNNIDYAILLLKGIVQKELGFMEARKTLRKMEKIKVSKMGLMKKMISSMKAGSIATKGKAMLVAKKIDSAMRMGEDAAAENLSSMSALNLLAQAGQELGAAFISIEALEIAVEYNPKNVNILDWLATEYADDKQGVKALQIRQQLSSMDPKNMEKQQAVRGAAALATMEKGHMEEKDANYRDMLKDKGESTKMEQEEKIVRDVDDVKDLITDLEKTIADGESTAENHRKLADVYQRGKDHEKALENYHQVVEKMGALDPYIDAAIEKSELAKLNNAIQEWAAYGEAPENKEEADKNIAQIEGQKLDYRKERAEERVKLYPNDTQLRYNLGIVSWDRGEIDAALQAFQIGQKNPSKKLSALVYLGLCFHTKGQYDMAIEQYNTAIQGMVGMHKEKLDALYNLGLTYEAMENIEKATECFKQIYQAKISYKDVAKKMESIYKK